jgi:hypothetical protein
MKKRVSKSQFETQGRGEGVNNNREQKVLKEPSGARTITEDYQAILAQELLINDIQESYSKYY